MPDITITITVTDWLDVPHDADDRRRVILDLIASTAAAYADRRADDLGVAIKINDSRGEA